MQMKQITFDEWVDKVGELNQDIAGGIFTQEDMGPVTIFRIAETEEVFSINIYDNSNPTYIGNTAFFN